jgi:hypothetical protein
MSKQRLGKRERMAGKRKMSMRKQGHTWIQTKCSQCSTWGEWHFGPGKAKKLSFNTKLVCGQCRSGNKTRPGDPTVGS